MAEAPDMMKAVNACAVPEADTDAPQHQKVPSADTAPAEDAEAQTQVDLPSATTPEPSSPQPARQRTPAQRKRDRKKGVHRRNNAEATEANADTLLPPSSSLSSSTAATEAGSPSSTRSPSPAPSNTTIPPSITMPPPSKVATAAKKAAQGKIVPLFIASIGNPPPTYAHTLHSAGHTLLDAVRDVRHFPAWQKDRWYANGAVSKQVETGVNRNFSWLPGIIGGGGAKAKSGGVGEGEEAWTLWKSPSLMNVSGKALAQAWGRWKRENKHGELVVLHDEMEKPLGKVTVRRGGASARGHNGLKSIATQVTGMPYVRIGIGIGRPESREPDVVANYVLRKMTPQERARVEGCADEVIRKLWEVQEGKV